MTDRQLLEAAAKAAGIKVGWRKSANCFCYSDSPYEVAWNPLADDGDALRLAGKLGICIEFAEPWLAAYAGSRSSPQFCERYTPGTVNAAVRRAIVKAASNV